MATAAEVPNQPIIGALDPGLGQARVDGGAAPLPGQGLDGISQGADHRLLAEQIEDQKVVGQQHGAVSEILRDTVAAQPNDIILFADHSDDPVVSRALRSGQGCGKVPPVLQAHRGKCDLDQREGLGDPLGGQGPSLEISHGYAIMTWNTAAIYALGKLSVVDIHQEEHNAFRLPASRQKWRVIVHCNT